MQTFTRAELEVMQVLWRHGSLKPGEIQKQFDRPVKNATLRSVLRVLLEKGHVNRTAVGKAFTYQAVTREEGALRRAIRQLIDGYCGGSPSLLVQHIVEADDLTLDDLDELRKLAATHKRSGKQKGGKRDD